MRTASPAELDTHPQLARLARSWSPLGAVCVALSVLVGTCAAAIPTTRADWVWTTTIAVIALYGLWSAYTDLRAHLILNVTTGPQALTLLALAITAVLHGERGWGDLVVMVAGVAVVGVVYLGLVLVNGTSPGDVKLAVVLAVPAGLGGWWCLAVAAALPYVLSLPHALVARVRSGRGARMPFAPYLSAGALVAVVVFSWG